MKKVLFLAIAAISFSANNSFAQTIQTETVTVSNNGSTPVSMENNFQDYIYQNAGVEQKFVHFIDGVQYNVTVREYFANPSRNHVRVETKNMPTNGATVQPVCVRVEHYALAPEVKNLIVTKMPTMISIKYRYRGEQKTIEIRQ